MRSFTLTKYQYTVIRSYFQETTDRWVKLIFKKQEEESSSTMMIRLVLKEDWCPIHVVTAKGEPIYIDKIDGPFILDVDPTMCDHDVIVWCMMILLTGMYTTSFSIENNWPRWWSLGRNSWEKESSSILQGNPYNLHKIRTFTTWLIIELLLHGPHLTIVNH